MTKIIWMSDPHFQRDGTIDGLNPRTRLDAAIAHVNANHADADFAILSGDLVGDDVDADYPAIAEYLGKCSVPIHPMMGNNDSRDAFRKHLTLPDTVMPDFVQYTLDTPDGVVICLDTHLVGSAAGQFCEDRLAWLDAVLKKNADKNVFVFMHHPPFALGLPAQDEIMLQDDRAFLDLMGCHSNVRHLFMGHVHRSTSGVVAGIPFASLGALSFQAPAPRPVWHWDTFQPPQDAPLYAVVHLNDANVIVQYTKFCDYAVGVETEH